jgi:hypothetical protein
MPCKQDMNLDRGVGRETLSEFEAQVFSRPCCTQLPLPSYHFWARTFSWSQLGEQVEVSGKKKRLLLRQVAMGSELQGHHLSHHPAA